MKKLIISLAALAVVAVFAVIVLGAGNVETDATEGCCAAKTECVMSASTVSSCCSATEAAKTAACDPANCTGAGCDHENCTGQCKETVAAKACNPATCSQHTAEK